MCSTLSQFAFHSINRFNDNAKEISRRYRDQPKRPLETAIYWVEYVARHRGAGHMKSGGQELTFLQYHNYDIFLTIVAFDMLVVAVFWFCCCKKSTKKVSNASRKKKTN